LFAYIVIVAFLFVRLLGADVIGDDESRALTAQRKKQKEQAKASRQGRSLAKSSITSGEGQQ
jgi:multiple sugar transport system permease protein